MGHILPGPQDAYNDKTKIENLRAKYSARQGQMTTQWINQKSWQKSLLNKSNKLEHAYTFGKARESRHKQLGRLSA